MFYADHTYMILDHTKIDFYYVDVDVRVSREEAFLKNSVVHFGTYCRCSVGIGQVV